MSSYRLSKVEKIRVLKKLLKFPRLSRTCQIVFKKKIQVKFIFFNFILFSNVNFREGSTEKQRE